MKNCKLKMLNLGIAAVLIAIMGVALSGCGRNANVTVEVLNGGYTRIVNEDANMSVIVPEGWEASSLTSTGQLTANKGDLSLEIHQFMAMLDGDRELTIAEIVERNRGYWIGNGGVVAFEDTITVDGNQIIITELEFDNGGNILIASMQKEDSAGLMRLYDFFAGAREGDTNITFSANYNRDELIEIIRSFDGS